jgi:hypothetical protein
MKSSEKSKENEGTCSCPYCDEGVSSNPPPFCQPCHVELQRCVKCDIEVEKTATVCPQCGQSLE